MKQLTAISVCMLLALGAPALADEMEMDHSAHMHEVVGDMVIHHPHIPAPPGPVKTAAAYMAFNNVGGVADRLVSVSSPVAEMASIHQTVVENDVAKMRPVEGGIEVSADDWVSLEPGGYHIMLMKLTRPLKEGDLVEITLTFEKAGSLTFEIPVVAPGQGMHGDGMEHDHNMMHGQEGDGG